jgi:hypothetical protein
VFDTRQAWDSTAKLTGACGFVSTPPVLGRVVGAFLLVLARGHQPCGDPALMEAHLATPQDPSFSSRAKPVNNQGAPVLINREGASWSDCFAWGAGSLVPRSSQ